jgi:hypothetical protein
MTKKIIDKGIGSVRTTVVFTNKADLTENMNLPLKQFSSIRDTITFLINKYKEEGINDNEKEEIEAIESLFEKKVTEINLYRLVDKTGLELFFKAKTKTEKTELSNRVKLLIGSLTFEKILNQLHPAFFYFVQERQNNLKKQKELEEKEAELNKREENKVGKFKRSGHLTDQILKYSYPKDKSSQLSIFDSLQDGTKKHIEIAGVEVSEIVEGIKLSPSETKVIDCLCKLLHENSQNSDAKREDYYSGNIGYELVDYGGDKKTPAPKLAFTLYELTREYKGGETIGGKDVENVKQILTELDKKRFLLSYVETAKKKDGGKIVRQIEDFRKLIHIVKISQTEYSKEDIELSKKEETIILLNPIFRRQIDSKFILYPNDINRRTIIAYGSHNVSDIALRLRDYLIRELSSKRYQPEISLDKLYYLLAEKWMRESRKKKVKEYTEKALETVTALGLLLSYEIKTASTGEPKVIFTLNKEWE